MMLAYWNRPAKEFTRIQEFKVEVRQRDGDSTKTPLLQGSDHAHLPHRETLHLDSIGGGHITTDWGNGNVSVQDILEAADKRPGKPGLIEKGDSKIEVIDDHGTLAIDVKDSWDKHVHVRLPRARHRGPLGGALHLDLRDPPPPGPARAGRRRHGPGLGQRGHDHRRCRAGASSCTSPEEGRRHAESEGPRPADPGGCPAGRSVRGFERRLGHGAAAGAHLRLWVLVCGTTVVAWIGLLQRLRAGRALYAASWVGYLALVALRAGGADAGLDRLLDLATGLVGGMILGLVYLSDFRAQFPPPRRRARRGPARALTAISFRGAEPAREGTVSLPPPASGQPGRLVPLGRGSVRAGAWRGPADLPLDRLLDVPLVPRHGARVLRDSGRGGRASNRDFVSIKVDREERPDVDDIYMRAVQMMTGAGGWPLSLFLTPDRRPFYGGTYFPPTSALGPARVPPAPRLDRPGLEVAGAAVRSSSPPRARCSPISATTKTRRARRRAFGWDGRPSRALRG